MRTMADRSAGEAHQRATAESAVRRESVAAVPADHLAARPEALKQRRLSGLMNGSPQATTTARHKAMLDHSPAVVALQRKRMWIGGEQTARNGPANEPVQRVLNTQGVARNAAYIDGLNADDFEGVLGETEWNRVRALLQSWVELDGDKDFPNDTRAVEAAVAAVGSYDEFENRSEDVGLDEPMLVNEELTDAYNTAGFGVDDRTALFSLLGEDGYQTLDDANCLGPLRVLHQAHGIACIEALAELHIQTLKQHLAQLANFSGLVTTLGVGRVRALITGINDVDSMNQLFANLSAARVGTLSVPVACELATKTVPQIAGINGQWAALRDWLGSVADLNLLLTITGAGYSYVECAALATRGGTPQEVRDLQLQTASYAILDQFVDEARRYQLSWANMVTVATDNPAAPYATLRDALRPRSLTLIDKNARFSPWITAVSNLITDAGYNLNVSAANQLPGMPETWERVVQVRNQLNVVQDTFVIHYHPGAAHAAVGSPYASPRHIKPVRGNALTPRVEWAAIPANFHLPGNRH